MSLFGGLFGGGGAGKSSLFSEGNKFKVHEDDEAAITPERQPYEVKKTRKRKQIAGDAQPQQTAEPAAKTAAEAANSTAAAVRGNQKKLKADLVHDLENKQAKPQRKHSKKAVAGTVAAAEAATNKLNKQGEQKSRSSEEQQSNKKRKKAKHVEPPAAVQGSDSETEDNICWGSTDKVADIKQGQQRQQQQQQQQRKENLDPAAAAEKLVRTIFVGNLPIVIKRKAVARLFAQYGAVESVRLRSVPLDLESKKKLPRKAAVIKGVVSGDRGGNNAYVVFSEAAAATAALAANMTEVGGHHIRVDRAAPPAAAGCGPAGVLYEPSRSVFVGNLDFKVTEEDLIRTFSSGEVQSELAGAVEAVRVVRDSKTNIGKGIAYVLFKTKTAARTALQLDGSKLRERAMRVSRVDRKASAGTTAAAAAAAAKQGGKFGRDGKPAIKGGKLSGHGAGGPSSRQGALGLRQGGVQKKSGASAADWQGLRTKGKGAGFRSAKSSKAEAAGKKSSGGGSKDGRARTTGVKGKTAVHGKRPAVAARKAKAKAAAAKAKKGNPRK